MRCVQQISMELSWDNCLPSLFVLQCCIVSDTVLLRKKKKSMTHIYQMNLHWTSLITLALFGSPPHTLSGRFLFIVKGAICWTPYSRKGQCCFAGACSSSSGSSAAFTLPNYYFARKDKCSKQHKAKTDHSRLGSTVLHWLYKRKIQSLGRALPSFMLDWCRLYPTVTQCLILRYSAVLHFSTGWRYLVSILTSVAVIQSSDNLLIFKQF